MTGTDRDYGFTTPPGGYRLPEELRLGEVTLQVADLARSIDYYERVVGLQVLERAESTATIGVRADGRTLVQLKEKRGVAAVPRRGLLGLYHFAILLPDRSSLARFVKHLSDVGEYAGMSDHYVSEAVYLTDPDGLGIEVYADRPRSDWKLAGSNISMASVALDLPDLLKAAGDASWIGAPAGTVIGHVHLFVDDLETAERFYHDGVGFDKVRLQFPGASFMSAGGYHHHLGTNMWAAHSPLATDSDARLLEWTVEVTALADLDALASSLSDKGFSLEASRGDLVATDPWGTKVRFRTAA